MHQAPTKSSAEVSVRQVEGKRDLDTFLRVPSLVFRDDPNWIAPLLWERKDHLNPKKNPFFQKAEVAYWLAEKNGVAVGRISAQINQAQEARYSDRTGHFGFIDGIDGGDRAGGRGRRVARESGYEGDAGPVLPFDQRRVWLVGRGL